MALDLEEQEQLAELKAWWTQYGNLIVSATGLANASFVVTTGRDRRILYRIKRSFLEKDAEILVPIPTPQANVDVQIAGTAVVEAISLPLIHFRFVKLEDQIAQVQAALGTISAAHLQCPNCGARLIFLLQRTCRNCGFALAWPKEVQQLQPTLSGS